MADIGIDNVYPSGHVRLTHAQADTAHGIARVELQAATRELEAIELEPCFDPRSDQQCNRCTSRAFIARMRLADARSLVDALESQPEDY